MNKARKGCVMQSLEMDWDKDYDDEFLERGFKEILEKGDKLEIDLLEMIANQEITEGPKI